ncbi:MAG: hypothetical protein J6R89_05825 [Clostridia bacterium]|nr:hypothetical protein [Clostridia bacterium]
MQISANVALTSMGIGSLTYVVLMCHSARHRLHVNVSPSTRLSRKSPTPRTFSLQAGHSRRVISFEGLAGVIVKAILNTSLYAL